MTKSDPVQPSRLEKKTNMARASGIPALAPSHSSARIRSLRRVPGRPLPFLALVATAAALAGCGPFGGDEELTEQELIAEGDAICERGREQYLDLQRDPPRSASEAAELTRRLIEITESEIEDLRELNAPVESEDALDDYLESREAGLEILREGLEAAEDQDAQAYSEAQAQVARGQVDRARLAEKVGFSECSQPLTDGSGPESGPQ